MQSLRTVAAMVCATVLWGGSAGAVTPEQRCQGGKNTAAGKYAACRQNAEKGLALTGDATRYDGTIAKCAEKFAGAWQREEGRAAAAGATCPDAPLLVSEVKLAVDAHADIIATALEGGGLIDCPADLATCTADLGTCGGSLGTCNANNASCTTA